MNLVIANTLVRQDESGRYLLNDLHRAAGGENRHRPKYWLGNQQTKALIAELEIGGIPPIETTQKVGSFACRELVYAYATWISAPFFLKVIRAYDALASEPLRVMPGQAERVRMGEPITPAELEAVLARPVLVPATEYLALKLGAGSSLPAAERVSGQHYSDEIRAEVLALGDKGWMPAEIAERTGVPRDTVHTMLFRARKAGLIRRGPRQGQLETEAHHGL